MSNNAANVSVGKPKTGGAIYTAPLSTALPTDATTALSSDYTCLGYANEDGLVNGAETDSQDIVAWGGEKVLTVRTSYSETYAFTLIESRNVDVLKNVYGEGNVTGTIDTGVTVQHTSEDLPLKRWVFEIVMSNDTAKRIVIPSGKVTEVGEVTYADGDAIGYETTISAFPDASGVTAYEYIVSTAAAG
ncbi:MAG: phage tail protein [Clostridiales Family XIII bacterium]|jgi:hypothetical protein|nr:phage tail protein [Clostridiales Family XIII bacterium]